MRGCHSTSNLSIVFLQAEHPSSMEVVAPFRCTEAAWPTLPRHPWIAPGKHTCGPMEDECFKRFVECCFLMRPVITTISDISFGDWPIFPVGTTLSKGCNVLNCNNFDAWSSAKLKFTAVPSPEGGLDIYIGSHVFHVRKHLSVLHPVVQMLLFASCDPSTSVISEDECTFRCEKSMLPKGVLEMAKKSLSPPKTKQALDSKCAAPGYGLRFAQEILDFTHADSQQALYGNGRTAEKTNILKQSNTCSRGSGLKPDEAINLQQQKQQQQLKQKQQHIGSVATGGHLWPSEVAATHTVANEDYCLRACQWETTIAATKWMNIPGSMTCSNNSGCIPTVKGISPGDSLNEKRFLKDPYQTFQCTDNAPVINFTKQIGEPDLHSGIGSNITKSTKNTSAAAATTWIVASAAPNHATGNLALLSDFSSQGSDIFLFGGDEGAMPMKVIGQGTMATETMMLSDVWYVPGLMANLVSVTQLAELDYSVAFGRGKCYIRSTTDGAVVGEAHAEENGYFAIDFLRVPS